MKINLTIKLLAVITAILMITALLPSAPFGVTVEVDAATVASGKCGSDLKWSLNSSGTLTVSGSGKMYDYSEDNEPAWFKYADNIKELDIRSGITYIGDCAFAGLANITDITVPGSVKEIGDYAFALCIGVTKAVLGNGVKTIGNSAFFYCVKLFEVDLPDSVTRINDLAFSYCIMLNSVKLPAGIDKVSAGVFFLCINLESVIIPPNVRELQTGSFLNCTGLREIEIPGSVVSLEESGLFIFYDGQINDDGVFVPQGDPMLLDLISLKCAPDSAAERYAIDLEIDYTYFDPVYYTVTYDPNDGKNVFTDRKIHGTKLQLSHMDSTIMTIKYDANGGKNAPQDQIILIEFVSWNTRPDGNGEKYLANQMYAANEPLTLYAQWQLAPQHNLYNDKPLKQITLNFNASGGSVSKKTKSMSASFKNWNTHQDGTGTSYEPGSEYTGFNGTTLYAQWENPKAGTLPVPEKEGASFSGWFTAEIGGVKVTSGTEVKGDMTLYAHWNDGTLFSDGADYQLYDGCIYCVPFGTSVSKFKSQFISDITVTDKNGNTVDSGNIGTGCSAEYDGKKMPVVMIGDTDGNGKIDSTDIILVKRHILKASLLSGAFEKSADTDGSGRIDSTDYITIKRHILGLAAL